MKLLFKKQLLLISLFSLTINMALANVVAPEIISTKPIPALSSINQLGDLKFNTPAMHRFTIDGVEVLYTPIESLPIVDISVNFKAGSAYDEQIKKGGFGISNLTASLLTKGTTTLSEDEFIKKSELLGIHLTANSDKEYLSVNLRSLSDSNTLMPAIELMSNALATPSFNQATLDRIKGELITNLQIKEQNPSYVASVAYTKALFGSHPYGHVITGDKNSLKHISSNELKSFKDTFLNQQNMSITITGKIDSVNAKKIAKILINTLPKGNPAPTIALAKKPKPTHIHINFPSSQTQIILGQLSSPFSNNDTDLQKSMDFEMANEVLAGGDFSAKLMQAIRVDKGYTYGIYGNDTKMSSAGVYSIRFSTQNKDAGNAIKETLKVIKDTQKTGITQDELSLAIFNNKNSYPNSFSSNAGIHSIANIIITKKLPDDYLNTYLTRLDNVTLDNANTALKNIDTDELIIITVGDKKPKF